ncbi:unnamed protein product [Malus baccata var. baccata]
MKEISMSSKETWSPMSLNHQIAPRFFFKQYQTSPESRSRLMVADPELIKLVSFPKKNGHVTMPPLNTLVNLQQMGTSTLEGEQWAKRRRLIKLAFHLENYSLVEHEGRCELDVAPEFRNLASDFITRTAFGSNCEEGKKIFELQKKQAVLVLEAYYDFYFPGKRHNATLATFCSRFVRTCLDFKFHGHLLNVVSFLSRHRFKPTKKNRMRYKLDNETKAILRGMIIKKEQAAMENGEEGANDLLGLLLQCKEQEQTSMTIEDVIVENHSQLAGLGYDCLIYASNWQEKAGEEVLSVCGKSTSDLDVLNHLKILAIEEKTKMEDYFLLIKTLVFSLVSVILYLVLRVVHVYWVRPRSLEKQLRKQGIRGRSYKLFHDDMKEMSTSSREAWSKPMSLNHQIAPRVLPYFHQMVQKYGKVSLGWMETRPRLIVTDPELIKDILINKNGHFIMPPLNPLVKLLQLGVSTLEGEQWTKRRRIINPAFHLEKLMGMETSFVTGCSGMIDRWEKLIGVEGSREVDVAPEFQNLISEVIALTAFGGSFEDGKLFELQKKQAALSREAYYGFYFPGFRHVKVLFE